MARGSVKDKPEESWRDWTTADAAAQPRRICSIAGCKEKPVRVKVTVTQRADGTPNTRNHAYCSAHVPE